jgi:hypothetical protein
VAVLYLPRVLQKGAPKLLVLQKVQPNSPAVPNHQQVPNHLGVPNQRPNLPVVPKLASSTFGRRLRRAAHLKVAQTCGKPLPSSKCSQRRSPECARGGNRSPAKTPLSDAAGIKSLRRKDPSTKAVQIRKLATSPNSGVAKTESHQPSDRISRIVLQLTATKLCSDVVQITKQPRRAITTKGVLHHPRPVSNPNSDVAKTTSPKRKDPNTKGAKRKKLRRSRRRVRRHQIATVLRTDVVRTGSKLPKMNSSRGATFRIVANHTSAVVLMGLLQLKDPTTKDAKCRVRITSSDVVLTESHPPTDATEKVVVWQVLTDAVRTIFCQREDPIWKDVDVSTLPTGAVLTTLQPPEGTITRAADVNTPSTVVVPTNTPQLQDLPTKDVSVTPSNSDVVPTGSPSPKVPTNKVIITKPKTSASYLTTKYSVYARELPGTYNFRSFSCVLCHSWNVTRFKLGCGCRNTEFGCCSDDSTPAQGPNFAGCGCDSSKYGCCPDGTAEASGDNFEGCKDIPPNLQESCLQPKERGACRNYTVKWFFDMDYGGCSRFWYGGCDGNNNRFKTKEECDGICVKPEGMGNGSSLFCCEPSYRFFCRQMQTSEGVRTVRRVLSSMVLRHGAKALRPVYLRGLFG